MRLKTLRKERPAFENEGAIINGSRMDLSNSEYKPVKYRTNNTFALPTSLTITPEINTDHSQPTSTLRRTLPFSIPVNASPYQAIEAAYLERGIRIHLNPSAAAAVAQQQSSSTENLNSKKSEQSLQRQRVFVNRNPSRSSSALNYSTAVQDTNTDSRPFSALQQISTFDFDPSSTHNVSYIQPIENQSSIPLASTYCSSSILTANQSDQTAIPPAHSTITNGTLSRETLTKQDPDLAYMSSLLKTTSGDSYRDTIRRRAGLRGTFAVHRHPQYSIPPDSRLNDQSPAANHRNSVLRTASIAVVPMIVTPSSRKVEKDILKHASRIRTNQIRDSFARHQAALRSQSRTNEHSTSNSHSPLRLIPQPSIKRNQIFPPSKSINLAPLELLLASPIHLSSPPARATSLTLHNRPVRNREHINTSKQRTRSSRYAFTDTPKNSSTDKQSVHNGDHLPSTKKPTSDLHMPNKARQSNSIDSGCYDRSRSSSDTRSITSCSVNQACSSLPSARLTSASTRRSTIQKKVSFEEPSLTMIITTATYV